MEHLHCSWNCTHIVSFNPSYLRGWFFFVQRRLLRPRAVRRPAPGPQHRSGSDIRMVLDPVRVHFCSSIGWLPGDILSSDALSCTLLTMPCHSVLSPRPKPTSPSSAEQSTGSGPQQTSHTAHLPVTRRHNKSVRNTWPVEKWRPFPVLKQELFACLFVCFTIGKHNRPPD